MKTSTAPGQVSFDCTQWIYGAFDSDTGKLVLVVEASSEIEALARVDSVAPLLGVRGVFELLVVQMDQMPAGVPTFLSAFFTAGKIGFTRDNVAPGTSTLQ